MHENLKTLHRFYEAFSELDAESMLQHYHDDIHFSDPAFPNLHRQDACDMWRMLCANGKDFELHYHDLDANNNKGIAYWEASYTFVQTGNTVINKIESHFGFEDGRIIRHVDDFDLWAWARMALGSSGLLLGWNPYFQAQIRQKAQHSLRSYKPA